MEACPGCNRTFMPDRLEVHLRSCMKGKSIVKEEEESKTPVQKPRGVICYICGKEFGSASIPIHVKSCIKKWETEEEKKPANKRRPVPEAPSDLLTAASNEKSFETYNKKSLMPCAGCGRTFNPDSLETHQRGCKDFKVVQKKAEEMEPVKVAQRPKALVCFICGR